MPVLLLCGILFFAVAANPGLVFAAKLQTSAHSSCLNELEVKVKLREAIAAAVIGESKPTKNLQIEILSCSCLESVPGRFEFLKNQKIISVSDPNVPILLQGRFVSPMGTSVPVWAKVRMSVEREVIRVKETIAAGTAISLEKLEVITQRISPFYPDMPQNPDLLVGKKLKRLVTAGMAIEEKWVEKPRLVERRAMVDVEVICGAARLRLHARTETSADSGETVSMRNPKTGRLFAGTVRDDGSVVVEIAEARASRQKENR